MDRVGLFTRMALITTALTLKKYMFIRENEKKEKNMASEKNRGPLVMSIKETLSMIKKKGI
jgi:hypothetical protein